MTITYGKYYNIALNWETCSDDDVYRFKEYFTSITKISNVKILCQKEWLNGTFIDMYIIDENNKNYHMRIDKKDNISDASHEDY